MWESFLHSETRGQPLGPGTSQLSQTPHPLPLPQKKMLPLFQLTQRSFSLFTRSERKIKKLCPESIFKSPRPPPPYPQLSPADCTFNVILGSSCFVLLCFMTPTISRPSFIKDLLSVFALCWCPGTLSPCFIMSLAPGMGRTQPL